MERTQEAIRKIDFVLINYKELSFRFFKAPSISVFGQLQESIKETAPKLHEVLTHHAQELKADKTARVYTSKMVRRFIQDGNACQLQRYVYQFENFLDFLNIMSYGELREDY